jgi:hypothetical protein
VRVYATNTAIDGLPPASLDGEATVTCIIERLDLLGGTYTLDVAVGRPDGTPYDQDHRCSFTMTSPLSDAGVFRPPHRWILGDGIVGWPPAGGPGVPRTGD